MTFNWRHRSYCDCLDEMRVLTKKLSIWNVFRYRSIISMLIEELQVHGNKMEAGLGYKKDILNLQEEKKKLTAEYEVFKKVVQGAKQAAKGDVSKRDMDLSEWVKELDDDS